VSTALREPPDLAADESNGLVARRAMIRWAVRLWRQEWRQQLLIVAMLAVAVAAMVVGTSVAAASRGESVQAMFGTGNTIINLPGTDPHLAADIASISRRFGPADVIENRALATGTSVQASVRAQDPDGPYGKPTLELVSGSYPSGPGQVALTSQLASLYRMGTGGRWRYQGRNWRVTGIVENPSNLLDEFALVAPGQLARPDQVSILLQASSAPTRLPAGARIVTPDDNAFQAGPSAAVVALVVSVAGLVFIGLVAVAGFTVMAQRRLRALGMLGSLGATERDIRLVMIAGGAVTGMVAAIVGTAVGFGAWFAYTPHLQADVAHAVDPLAVPWPVIIAGIALAIATAMVASWQPARAVARIPVAAALSGRAPAPAAARWPTVAGLVALAGGLALLSFSGGWGSHGTKDTAFLAAGLIGVAVGGFLLAPASVRVLATAAAPSAAVAFRIALRDLARYRARSGAALGAVGLAVFLAMVTCLAASFRFANPLDWTGPNLAANELLIQQAGAFGQTTEPAVVRTLAAQLHATSVLHLYGAGRLTGLRFLPYSPVRLWQEGTAGNNFSGPIYVATPALLGKYGIKQSQIAPNADILTMRPGLATEPRMVLTVCPIELVPASACQPHSILGNPAIQTIPSLPSGTSEPNTVITMHGVHQLGLRVHPGNWLIQSSAALTAVQISEARLAVTAAGGQIETKTQELSLTQIGDGAAAAGVLIALALLVMSVGLVRSETSGDLRTLAATGASAATRRAITAATAGALGLLGTALGTFTACLAVLIWAHGSPGAMFSHVPGIDYLLILAGLPLAATAGGWLLAGREPPAIARQPVE
jgi:putative ABC transport system permease protein